MHPSVELHLDTDDQAARRRLSEALLAAVQCAGDKLDSQPLRRSDPDTTRYGWASLAVQLAIAAHRARSAA